MTMTAKELYEIVKDVDRNAWPESSAYMTHTLTPFWVYLGKAEDSRLMELAFVGAMYQHQIDRGGTVPLIPFKLGTKYVLADADASEYDTLVEALAAACKEEGTNGS